MSTIRTIIDRVNENRPNVLSQTSLVAWLAELDGKIAMDIFLMDMVELPQFQYDPEVDLDRELLVKFPHDDIYYYWLCAKIDAENGEYNKYQNTMQLYNASYSNFVQWFLTVYEPAQSGCCRRHNVTHYISAYGLAVQQGFQGTLDEWLASLRGDKGDKGDPFLYEDFTQEQLAALRGKDGADGKDGAAGKDGADGYTPQKGVDYFTDADKAEIVSEVLESEEISGIAKDLADIKADLAYVPIDITAFSNSAAGIHEIGSRIAQAQLNWSLNKTPESQRLNIGALGVDDRAYTVPGPITGDKTFTLTVTDERGATDSASTAISFLNGVYYGVMADGATIDSAAILSLTRKLQGARGITFTADAGANKRIAYAIPSRYGTPSFKDAETGFQAGFTKAATIAFTNASGYTENYDVWLSTNTGLGSMTVVVS